MKGDAQPFQPAKLDLRNKPSRGGVSPEAKMQEIRQPEVVNQDIPWELPQVLAKTLAPETPIVTESDFRRLLVGRGLCTEKHPPVTLELYGSLRTKTGCGNLPVHAHTIGEALQALKRICPSVLRVLPDEAQLGEHYRFSVNGGDVFTDLRHPLKAHDHLILFSASVGG